MFSYKTGSLCFGKAEDYYSAWLPPTCIIVDGPYGVGGYPGDCKSAEGLAEWYFYHIEAWSKYSSASTTLWFWGTELSWVTVHPIFKQNNWIYKSCNIWNKGVGHIAGNVNTGTIRRFPVVSEVCVQYIRPEPMIEKKSMQTWLHDEWKRTGLSFRLANEACGVKNAATRKYLTLDEVWYFPPEEMFYKLAYYANKFGQMEGKPYFSLDGNAANSEDEWKNICRAWAEQWTKRMRAKFFCPFGVTNVWDEPAVRGAERVKIGNKAIHNNQKPLTLISRLIEATTEKDDVVWDPFAGTATAGVAAINLKRKYFGAERNFEYFEIGRKRIEKECNTLF